MAARVSTRVSRKVARVWLLLGLGFRFKVSVGLGFGLGLGLGFRKLGLGNWTEGG